MCIFIIKSHDLISDYVLTEKLMVWTINTRYTE